MYQDYVGLDVIWIYGINSDFGGNSAFSMGGSPRDRDLRLNRTKIIQCDLQYLSINYRKCGLQCFT